MNTFNVMVALCVGVVVFEAAFVALAVTEDMLVSWLRKTR